MQKKMTYITPGIARHADRIILVQREHLVRAIVVVGDNSDEFAVLHDAAFLIAFCESLDIPVQDNRVVR